ncbi:hypothetical protein ZWY2020_005142 [Hordeum vulgare]|nr:hypothetical protein ZWY2020_005142 [Hordeum vulgare]
MISSYGVAPDGVVAYSFATINNTMADGLTVFTNQSEVVLGSTLFGIDHPTLSVENEFAGFVVLSLKAELWGHGDGQQGSPRQASFNTSFTMDGLIAGAITIRRHVTSQYTFVTVPNCCRKV